MTKRIESPAQSGRAEDTEEIIMRPSVFTVHHDHPALAPALHTVGADASSTAHSQRGTRSTDRERSRFGSVVPTPVDWAGVRAYTRRS